MSSVSRLRPSVLLAREQFQTGYEDAKRLHMSGLASIQTCAKFSSIIDAIVTQLYEAILTEHAEGTARELRERISIVPVGGYGRRQLAPFSDLDLMVLYTGKLDETVRRFTQRFTQDLYDAGMKPGHSLRTAAEAVQLARSDAVIGTSLIEARLLLGSSQPFEAFRASFRQMMQRRTVAMSRQFIDARAAERHKFGGTVFLLEPNLKRSPGGLRDIHLLRWLWFAKTGESEPERLLLRGVLSNFDYRRLMSSQSFLLQLRNEMHFGAGNASDVLDRAEQIRVAEALGFRGRGALLPVEQFMRDYFRHTSHVSFMATRACELASPPTTMSRVLEPMLGQSISRDYRMGLREISATQLGSTKLTTRLSEAVRLLDLSRLYDKRIAQETWYHVYRSAPNYSLDLEPETIARFRDMLSNPHKLGETLRKMHELGVLEKILPDFTTARWLLQFNRYHKYTVDEHCLRAVIEATRLGERTGLLGQTYRKLKRKWLLHLALLVHDLGKGQDRDHSVVGEEIARRVGARLELDAEATEMVASLVRDHLNLYHVAFRRDTSDLEFLKQFTEEIGSVERLEMLFLLTCADLAAVGPGVLNDWKVEVLSDLFRRMRAMWAVESEPGSDQRQLIRQGVWQCLTPAESNHPWFERQFATLPESFLCTRSPELVADTLRRLHALEGGRGTAWGRYVAESKTVEFTAGIHQGEARGIFSAMAGVLSSRGLSILAAETATLAEGLLLLRYQATDSQSSGPTDKKRLEQLAKEMVESIDSDAPPNFRRYWGTEKAEDNTALTNLPIDVQLDGELSQDNLIVEVFTFDRIGLLYDLARTLHEMELSIRFAKIGTYLDQVVDVFYLTERDGTKPADAERLKAIRERLLAVVEKK